MSNSHYITCIYCYKVAVDVIAFRFSIPTDTTYIFKPGLYVVLSKIDNNLSESRAYTITASSDNSFEIIVKKNGEEGFSSWIHQNISPGSQLYLISVDGEITYQLFNQMNNILLLSGGSGINLPISILRQAINTNSNTQFHLYTNTPTLGHIPILPELISWNFNNNYSINTNFFITRDELYHSSQPFINKGRFNKNTIQVIAKDIDATLICGSPSFVEDTKKIVLELIPNKPLFIEAFTKAEKFISEEASLSGITITELGNTIYGSKSSSLLEILEKNNIPIKSKCRSGICGSCKIKILNGDIHKEPDFALSKQEHSMGYALACCSYPTNDLVTISLLSHKGS